MKYCTKCGKEHVDEAVICVGCGCEFKSIPVAQKTPMKWYKFLIYFSLFASAFISLVSGISQIAGALSVTNNPFLLEQPHFAKFDNAVKYINITYGLLLFGMCALAIITRQSLAKYKRSGPTLLYIFYVSDFILTNLHAAAYYIAAQTVDFINPSAITEIFSLDEFVTSFLSLAVLVSLNYIYFKKRERLFIN